MKKIPGGKGGTITPMEKGQQIPGGGGKKGAKSFKRLFKNLLKDEITDAQTGIKMTRKQAAALKMLAIVFSKDSGDADRIRAFQTIRDTIGEKPTDKQEITGKGGTPLMPSFPTDITIVIDQAPTTSYVVDADKTNQA